MNLNFTNPINSYKTSLVINFILQFEMNYEIMSIPFAGYAEFRTLKFQLSCKQREGAGGGGALEGENKRNREKGRD